MWSPVATTCTLLNLETNKPAVISTLAADVVLLILTIVGLFRMQHLQADNVFAWIYILWKQVRIGGSLWFVTLT